MSGVGGGNVAGGGQAGSAGVRGSAQSGGAGGGGESATGEDSASQDIAGNTMPTSIPGLFGNQKELQIDVSRLPRLDEYNSLITGAASGQAAATLPSDVKTVAYYLRSPDAPASAGQSALSGGQSGLVRRELDRAVSAYASGSGQTDQLDLQARLMAREVTSLDFQYHDGSSWVSTWDSDAAGGLPMAIEIRVGIASPKSRRAQRAAGGVNAPLLPAADDLIYRLVVRIPVAKPASEYTPAGSEEMPADRQDSAAGTSTSGSATPGSGAAASPGGGGAASSGAPAGGGAGGGGAAAGRPSAGRGAGS